VAGHLAFPRLSIDNRTIDAAVVGGLLVADLAAQIVVAAGGHAPSAAIGVGPVLVATLCAGVFWWRRRRPLLVLGASVASIGVASALAPPGLVSQHTGIPLAMAAYAAGSWATRRGWAAALPAGVLALTFAAISAHAQLLDAAAVALVIVALPWVAGQAARSRRLYLEEVERRLADAEAERDANAKRAVLDERRHIARELHDVVAHHVSLIGVQAGAARVSLNGSSDATRDALAAIERSSRTAVGEMRHLLDVWRAEDGEPTLVPEPGLGMLAVMVSGFREAGLELTVQMPVGALDLSPVLDLCCYRIVEEALTNVARHSTATTATVDINVEYRTSGERHVRLTVSDMGPPRPAIASGPGGGRGLIGMRERVALFGGSLFAGPNTQGGFTVRADIDETAPMTVLM
jgi:signal transduction histidine kinase